MDLRRKAIVAVGVTVAVAAGGAAAYAATNGSSTGHDPQPNTRTGYGPGPGHHGGPGPGRGFFDADTRAVLEQLRTAVLDRAPAIVGPVLDQAVADGKLTAAQAATARQALGDLQAGRRPSADALALLRDEQVRAVAQDAFKAVAAQAVSIAAPILDQAVADGKLTQAEADAVKARIQEAATRGVPFGGPGHRGPGGPGRAGGPGFGGRRSDHGRGHFGGPGRISADVLKQVPAVAEPIIAKALADGKITQAQADSLRQAATAVADQGPSALAQYRDLLRDEGVRDVVHDIGEALAAKVKSGG